jgi:hypothetical protein
VNVRLPAPPFRSSIDHCVPFLPQSVH